MSNTEHCIPQHSSQQPSILDSIKCFAVCEDLAATSDLVQKFVPIQGV